MEKPVQVDFDKVIVDTSDKEKMFDMQDKNMVKKEDALSESR